MCIIHTRINEVLGVTLYSAFNLIKTFRIMIRKKKGSEEYKERRGDESVFASGLWCYFDPIKKKGVLNFKHMIYAV